MKKSQAFTLPIFAALFTSSVIAAPVTYQFTGLHTGETDALNNAVNSVDYLFANGTQLTFTFTYDADAPVTVSDIPGTNAMAPYGRLSFYESSLADLHGTVGGYSFSAATGGTNVANSNPGDATFMDGIFNMAGLFEGGPVGTGFSGFTIGDFALISAAQYSVGPFTYLPDQSLPNQLTDGLFNTGGQLIFLDSANDVRVVQFWGGHIEAVPLPAAVWLFGAALVGLVGVGRKRTA